MNEFVNFHSHSHKSFGDSILPTDRLVNRAKELGHPAVALTDHGSLVEMPNFFNTAEKAGIKPIIGVEAYCIQDELKGSEKSSQHLIVIVKNEIGWQNMLQLTYKANVPVSQGGSFYGRPRFTDADCFEHQEGLVFSSACVQGVINDHLNKGDETNARLIAERWRDNVEDFYLEIMPHAFEMQQVANRKIVEIAKDLEIPLLATLDVHYEKPEMHEAWVINGAIRRRQTIDTFEPFSMTPDMYFKTLDEIVRDMQAGGISHKDTIDAIQNSLKINEKINFKWVDRMNKQPVFNADINAEDRLKELSWKGLCARFGGAKKVSPGYVKRLRWEFEVITTMGFANYFLILEDMISWAKLNGVIVGPGRGSACGALMLWCLGVTEIDSLKYSLPFERFLNPERLGTVPDVDVDLDSTGREKVIGYLKNKYGVDHVFQVANHAQLKAPSAFSDVARFYNMSFDAAKEITKLIPTKFENDDGETITPSIAEIKKMAVMKPYMQNPQIAKIFDLAQYLEGSYRQASKHAGAVIITDKPVTQIAPVMRPPNSEPNTIDLQTQWDKKQLEIVGLHKYDLLGLSTLTVLNNLEKIIGIKCTDILHDDQKTWEFLHKAKNMNGIFQLASRSMKQWCRKIIPPYKKGITGLVDYLSDINAINRPAVLDAGMGDMYVDNLNSGSYDLKFDYDYIRDVLNATHGIILYQEQVIFLAKSIAGFSFGKGDILRRNLENMGTAGKRSEKVVKENEKFKSEFISGAKDLHGYSNDVCLGLWDWLCDSSGYGFNKCISGDTLVYKGDNSKVTLKEAFGIYHSKTATGKKWRNKTNPNCGVRFLSYDPTDDRVKIDRVMDIMYSGKKEVFRITTKSGKTIKATKDHRFLTAYGWNRLSQLIAGDKLIASDLVYEEQIYNRKYNTSNKGNEARKGTWGKQTRQFNIRTGESNVGFIDGLFALLTKNKKALSTIETCMLCGKQPKRFEIHHVDGDHQNNDLQNLLKVCVSCHKKAHYAELGRNVRFQKGYPTFEDEIVSIKFVGEEDTYDVEMQNEHHNFIANGLVSHNSHSWAYSLLGYWTAYFKANYPLQFYVVSINEAQNKGKVKGKEDPVEQMVKEAQSFGLDIKLPNNRSKAAFCIADKKAIVYGLNMIKGMSDTSAVKIAEQTFESFADFCNFIRSIKGLNKKHVEILLKIGYFEEFGKPQALWREYEKVMWELDNVAKKDEWKTKKDAGRKVREFSDLKFESTELEGNKKEWILDLIGFSWENRLFEVLKTLDKDKLDDEIWCVGEITNTLSGVTKGPNPRAWLLLTLKTIDGEKRGFTGPKEPRMLMKGQVIVCNYQTKPGPKGDNTTFFNIEVH